jgi:hypothetical protein
MTNEAAATTAHFILLIDFIGSVFVSARVQAGGAQTAASCKGSITNANHLDRPRRSRNHFIFNKIQQ